MTISVPGLGSDGQTDGQTDRQTDGQTDRIFLLREENDLCTGTRVGFCHE